MRQCLLVAAVLLAICTSICGEEPVDRTDAVRALLDRSRLLGDTHFAVPVGLWTDYLRDKAEAAGIEEPPPVPLIVSEGLYAITLQDDASARVTATVTLHVFRPAQCRNLMVLSARKAWEKVTVNGKPASMATADGWLRWTPDAPGEYVIQAEAPIKGTATLDLPIPATSRTFVTFDAPIPLEVSTEGAVRPIAGDKAGGTHGRLALLPRGRLQTSWQPPQVKYERKARYQLSGDIVWNLGAGSQRVDARLRVGIVGSGSDRLDLTLPSGADRVTVTGPDVRDTQVSGNRATIFLRGRVRDRTGLAVGFERPAATGGTASFEGITIDNGHWASGTLVVTNSAGGSEVLPHSASGVEEMSLSAIPPSAAAMMSARPSLSYRFTSRRWSLQVETLNLGDYALRESVADLAHYEVSLQADGSMMCKASYEVRNRTQQFLRVDLPRGAQVLMARVNELSRPLSPVADAANAYRVPLVRSKATLKGLVSFPVEVIFVCRTAPMGRRGQLALPLPRIDLPVAYAWCELYVPRGAELEDWAGPMRQVDTFSSETASASLTYGAGELAEGYAADDRPTVELAAGEVVEAVDAPEKPPSAVPVLADIPAVGGLFARAEPPQKVTAVDLQAGSVGKADAFFLDRAEGTPALPPSDAMESSTVITAAVPGNGKAASITLPTITLPTDGDAKGNTAARVSSLTLSRNYFRAGRDFYEKGDFVNARKSLTKAVELAPGSVEAGNASRLLSNVGYAGGKVKATSQAEKAAGKQVERELLLSNAGVLEQQKLLLRQGNQAVASGKVVDAEIQLKAAQKLGEQLLTQGVAVREQKKLLEQTKDRLVQLKKVQSDRDKEITKRAEELEKLGRAQEALYLKAELSNADASEVAAKARTKLVLQKQLKEIDKSNKESGGLAVKDTGKDSGRVLHGMMFGTMPPSAMRPGKPEATEEERAALRLGTAPLVRRGGDIETKRLATPVIGGVAAIGDWGRGGEKPRDQRQRDRKEIDESSRPSRTPTSLTYNLQGPTGNGWGPPATSPDETVQRFRGTREARQRQVDQLWAESQKSASVYKYDDAMTTLDRLLAIDPDNTKARRFRQDYAYLGGMAQQLEQRQSGRRETQKILVEADEATVPWHDIYRYPDPKTWNELTAKRKRLLAGAGGGGGGQGDPATATRRKLQAKGTIDGESWSLSIRLTQTGLGRALGFIAEAARAKPREINIIVDRKGIADAGVDLDEPIDLNVDDVSIGQALAMVLGGSLTYGINTDGSVIVSGKQAFQQGRTVKSYFVGDLVRQVPDFGDTVPRMNLAEPLIQDESTGESVDLFTDEDMDEGEFGGDRLRELIERTVHSGDRWESEGGRGTIHIDPESGQLIVQQTPEGHARLQELLGGLAEERNKTALDRRLGGRMVVETTDQVATRRFAEYEEGGKRLEALVTKGHDIRALRQRPDDLEKMVRQVVKAESDRPALVKIVDGSVTVTGTEGQQRQVRELVRSLEVAQGPQVEVGTNLALQRAQRQASAGQQQVPAGQTIRLDGSTIRMGDGLRLSYDMVVTDLNGRLNLNYHGDGVSSFEPVIAEAAVGFDMGVKMAPTPGGNGQRGELRKFFSDNYDWVATDIGGNGQYGDFERKLRDNFGQKVPVSSINLNVDPQTAGSLGVRFTRGRNGVVYATIDEAQFRTLAEVSAKRPVVNVVGGNNFRQQETIVGTDALLANGMVGNVTFAGDTKNKFDVNGNAIEIVHEDYLVIDNGDYLTAVRADEMRHWTAAPSSIPFAMVPQTIDVPRVGRQVRLEKTLVDPTDELVIRANYVWKGDS